MNKNILSSWIAFAHAKGFSSARKMDFLIKVIHNNKISLDEALTKIEEGNKLDFNFTDKEWNGLSEAVLSIPSLSFLVNKLAENGIEVIPVMDSKYPAILKSNLKKNAPILIYAKGNLDLLAISSVAIVGARKSGLAALEFTDFIAKKTVADKRVVVSGFAKGVDRRALDSALAYKGKSVIVLPQGILTYSSKSYYQPLVNGNIVIVSTYHPNAKWSVGLAMDRNKVIYGLAEAIYVAESNNKGGTWEGVLNGLKRNRTIYVRNPLSTEKNANLILIEKGATPVDTNGVILDKSQIKMPFKEKTKIECEGSKSISDDKIKEVALKLLKGDKRESLTTKDLGEELELNGKEVKKLSRILNSMDELDKYKKGVRNYYYLKSTKNQSELF